MTYRLAKRSDFATGLTLQQSLFDYWGNVVLPVNARVETQSQEGTLLAQPLWIWDGHAHPTMPPKDSETPKSFRVWLELEIDSLRKLAKTEHLAPANFLSIIWRHSCTIEAINRACPWHPLAFLCFGSHPSNALRNAYACAILADRIATRLGLTANERRSVVCGALTMNWSIFDTQDKLSSSKVNPTSADMQRIKLHPEATVSLLKAHGLSNEHWLQAVGQHHEEPDGKGYPSRLAASQTYIGAQILRACDRLVAMTASRRFRTGMLTGEAMKTLAAVIPDNHGILTALEADMGEQPPGGIWLEPHHGHLYLSLGPATTGEPEAFSISARGAPPLSSFQSLVEILHPEWDNTQYRLAVSRIDALGHEHLPLGA